MENITHTLIGLAAGEAFARCTRPAEDFATGRGLPQAARRSLFVTLAAIGGNAPDLDLAWSYAGSDRRLGYALEHRGYTHTVVGCLVLAGLLYAGAEWWMHRRGLAPTGRDRIQLGLVAVLGTMLHLGMDALNSYGVHPFWPFDNRWFYGDSIFIAEPLFWLASVPLIFLMRSRLARWLMGLVGTLALGVCVWIHRGAPLWEVGIAIVTVGLLAAGRLASARSAALASAAAMALIVGISVTCAAVAARRVEAIVSRDFPGDRMLDHILTPTPTDPLCWDALILATRDDQYTVRHAVLSIAPPLASAAACPELLASPRTNPPRGPASAPAGRPPATTLPLSPAPPMSPVGLPDSPSIQWRGQYSMSRSRLVRLVEAHCDAAALMRFARAPFAFQHAGSWFLGDLRFGWGAGFQIEVRGGPPGGCAIDAPWIAPRTDLLSPHSP